MKRKEAKEDVKSLKLKVAGQEIKEDEFKDCKEETKVRLTSASFH
jgi:hypothetical protein